MFQDSQHIATHRKAKNPFLLIFQTPPTPDNRCNIKKRPHILGTILTISVWFDIGMRGKFDIIGGLVLEGGHQLKVLCSQDSTCRFWTLLTRFRV